MKKKIICMLCSAAALLSGMGGFPAFAGSKNQSISATSPDGSIVFNLTIEDGSLYYTVSKNGYEVISKSALGYVTNHNSVFENANSAYWYTSHEITSGTDSYSPLVGEQKSFNLSFNKLSVPLKTSRGGDVVIDDITIEAAVYNEGVALRYIFPKHPQGVYDELTEVNLPHDENIFVAAHEGANQSIPKKIYAKDFDNAKLYQRPMTVKYPNGFAMTICEANVDNYSVFALKPEGAYSLGLVYPEGLKARNGKDSPSYNKVYDKTTYNTPWRVFVIGENETDLAKNAPIIESLNEPADEDTYKFSEWVEPGSALRAASGMNTTAIKGIIDQASAHDFKYVLLDTGWYGPEFDVNCDPRLDPTKLDPENEWDKILLENYFGKPGEGKYGTGEGIFKTSKQGFDVYKTLAETGSTSVDVDIPAICDYANAKGIGIILYVNGVYFPDSSGRDRFDADELFTYFEKWGVKGVKPGFVACRTQEFETNMQTVIEAAARHKLILTIHDEYVISGTQRTFPNLFCTEGILGDEAIGRYAASDGSVPTQTEYDIATLFTRTIQSPADHTFCYPGKATKAYAVASPIMFRTGMNMLYWYTNPNSIPVSDRNKIKIWDGLPGTWDKTLYLEGALYEYATYARKSFSGDWYIGSLTSEPRDLKIPLTFLDEGVKYRIEVYRDGADANSSVGWNNKEKGEQTLLVNSYIADSATVLENSLVRDGGYAVKATKATETDILTLPVYSKALADTETESTKEIQIRVDLKYLTYEDVRPVIENGRTLVPFRLIFEALGAEVSWDEATATATAVKDGKEVVLTQGSKTAYVDGKEIALDVGAKIISDRFVVPVRFIAEAFGCAVHWDDGAKTVVIRSLPTSQTLGEGAIKIKGCSFNAYHDGNDEIGEYSYDGDTSTVWSCEGKEKYITYDLGEEYDVSKVSIMWNKGDQRKAYYNIYVSSDNQSFTQVFTGESAGNVKDGYEDTAIGAKARYIKVEVMGTSTGTWNAIKEIFIYK